MSRRLQIACEGPTDYTVILAAADAIIGEYVPVLLQPEMSAANALGPHGGGWKGVKAWCEQIRAQGGIGTLAEEDAIVVVHLDADVADEAEIACARPCPPPSDTTDALAAHALNWLGETAMPPRTLLCLPSKCTEAWILAGLFPDDAIVAQGIECRPSPEALLVPQRPKFIAKKGGRYRKLPEVYTAHRAEITVAWPTIDKHCTRAKSFGDALRLAAT